MASASKTPNLNLPQWVGTEKPERTDFNAAFDAIDTTVASHLAESSSKHIHSSGENWIRFDDGTQICYDRFRADDTLEFGSGTYSAPYRSASIRFDYPVSFVSHPTVTASCIPSPETTGADRGVVAIIHAPSAGGCSVQVFRITSSNKDAWATVSVQAIGRWK